MIDLFGAPLQERRVKVPRDPDDHEILPRSLFTPDSIHAMFQSLDINGDGLVCAQDLSQWQSQNAAKKRTLTKFGSSHACDASPYVILLDEFVAFLHICGSTPSVDLVSLSSSGGRGMSHYTKRKKRVRFENESSTPTPSFQSNALSEEGLARCLALFPTLAFDWSSPLNLGSSNPSTSTMSSATHQRHTQGTFFNREKAATWFCRIDSNSKGWITAADLRVWRRMLLLGRSEDDLVLMFFPSDANANKAAAKALIPKSAPSKVPIRRRSSLFTIPLETQVQGSGSAVIEDQLEIMSMLKPWEFYMVLRENPMLAAELCVQVALLDFMISGGHSHKNGARALEHLNLDGSVSFSGPGDSIGDSIGDSGDLVAELDIRDIYNPRESVVRSKQTVKSQDACLRTVNNVPSDTAISAFMCVAKLKLCRLTSAYREASAQDDWIAASVLYAIDHTRCGYVSFHDVQKYLQRHANLRSVSLDDMCCLLDENFRINDRGNLDTSEVLAQSATKDVAEVGGADPGQLLDQEVLRQIFRRPAFSKFAKLLCRFVQVQQEFTSRQQQGIKTPRSKGGSDTSSSRGGTIHVFSTQPPKLMTMKERIHARQAARLTEEHILRDSDCSAALSSVEGNKSHTRGGNTAIHTPVTQRPEVVPMFDAGTKHKLPRGFGQVALQKWFKELDVNGDGLVTSRDLSNWCAAASCQGLVHEADLKSLFHPSLPNFASLSFKAPHMGTGETQSQSSSPTTIPHEVSENNLDTDHDDWDDNAHFTSPKVASLSISGNLNEVELAAALERRPLLAAQLVLIRRISRAVQLMHLAKASANEALRAVATAATAANWAASVPPDRNQRAHVWAATAKSTAQQAVARARSTVAEVIAYCAPSGRYRTKISGENADSAARELEVKVEEADASDPQGTTARAARRALHDYYLIQARRSVTRLSIEVALEVKLLVWREADHFPNQLQQLRALLPLSAASSRQLSSRMEEVMPVKEEPLSFEGVAERIVSESSEPSTSESLPMSTYMVSETRAKKRSVPAQQTRLREKLGSMMAGSSDHFNNMTQSLGDAKEEKTFENICGVGDAALGNNPCFDSSAGWTSHQDSSCGTCLDRRQGQATAGNESRIAVRNRAKARARTMSPRRLHIRNEASTSRAVPITDTLSLQEYAEGAATMPTEHSRINLTHNSAIETGLKAQTISRRVPARKASFREKLSGMMAGSSGHFKNMALSLDDDERGDQSVEEKGYVPALSANANSLHKESSADSTSHQVGNVGTSLDRQQGQTTAKSESRIAARNRAKARARTMSPRRPPPREIQRPVEPVKATPTSEENRKLPLDRSSHNVSNYSLPQRSAALWSISSSSSSSSTSSSDESEEYCSGSEGEKVRACSIPKESKGIPLPTELSALPTRSLLLDMLGDVNTTASNPVEDLGDRFLGPKTSL